MKSARLSELKSHLSAYLDEVRAGETIVVFDGKTPIARIVPYARDEDILAAPTQGLGVLRKLKPVKLRRPVDILALLRDSRDQR